MWFLVPEDLRGVCILLLAIVFPAMWTAAIRPPRVPNAPLSIFRLQRAWTISNAQKIINAWADGKLLGDALGGVLCDFFFLVHYSTLGGLVCQWAATWPRVAASPDWVKEVIYLGAWSFTMAAIFDALEDTFTVGLLFVAWRNAGEVKPGGVDIDKFPRPVRWSPPVISFFASFKSLFIGLPIVVPLLLITIGPWLA